jgi:hypothetical protein
MNISTRRAPFWTKRYDVRRYGKGYLRRSVKIVLTTLGMQENTCMTVAPRDELFILIRPFWGLRYVTFRRDSSPPFNLFPFFL